MDTACNGRDALEKLAEARYALVVLDLMMPEMDGYQFVRHLEEQSFTSRPRVLVLTAGMKVLRSELVVGSLPKPFDIDLLVNTVSGCIDASAPLRQPDVPTDPAQPARPN